MASIRKPLLLACAGLLALSSRADAGALAEAAAKGDIQAVRSLLTRANANEPGSEGTPPLHWIVRMQDAATARVLLKAGADANLANRYGVRPLHVAIANGDLAMVKLLLEARADPNSTDVTGENCMLMAARAGRLDVVETLLASGAKPDEVDPNYKQTPLMVAARLGHADIVQALLRQHARVDLQTRKGTVPRFRLPSSNAGSKGDGIVRGGWPDRGQREATPGAKTALLFATREGHLEVVKQLLAGGADIEKADADGVTPLLMAVLNGQIPVAEYLLDRGANVKAMDWYGQTPLFAAVDLRDLDVAGPTRDNRIDRTAALQLIKDILARSPDVNARTKEYPPERRWVVRLGSLSWVDFTGQTAFLRAALSGDVTVMRLLLDHGADAKIPTFTGTTPLMAAAGVNWTVSQTYDEGPAALLEAVKLAYEKGDDVNAENQMGLRAIHGAANRGSDDIIKFLVEKGAAIDTPDKNGRTPIVWAQGVFLATHPPEPKPRTVALLRQLQPAKQETR
jgi:ankyrin repeat protein